MPASRRLRREYSLQSTGLEALRSTLAIVLLGVAGACGSEAVCPAGTEGSPCAPAGDLKDAPDVPPFATDVASLGRVHDGGAEVGLAETETLDEELPTDTNTDTDPEEPGEVDDAAPDDGGGGDTSRAGPRPRLAALCVAGSSAKTRPERRGRTGPGATRAS